MSKVVDRQWLTLQEAAELVGKHPNTVARYRSRIKHRRDGHGPRARLLFDLKSLHRWAKAYAFMKITED